MKVLLYSPDNEATNNFMPHLWMFLLKSLTPPPHEVVLLDGNTRRMSGQQVIEYGCDHHIGLVAKFRPHLAADLRRPESDEMLIASGASRRETAFPESMTPGISVAQVDGEM